MKAVFSTWIARIPTLVFALGFAAAGYWMGSCGDTGDASGGESLAASSQSAAPSSHDHAGSASGNEYVCPMHPQIRQDEPGTCPICFMDLVPVADDGGDDGEVPTLRLSAAARALADVQQSTVARIPLQRDIRVFGRVGSASTGDARLTSWTAGRIDRLYVTTIGEEVRRGQRLARVYSPEIVVAQETLIHAREILADATASGSEGRQHSARMTEQAALTELRLLGVADEQIEALVEDGVADERVTVYATAGGTVMRRLVTEGDHVQRGTPLLELADLEEVWVQLDIYERDLPHVRVGTPVTLQMTGADGEPVTGTIAFIDPFIDAEERVARARVVLENSSGELRPEQFVEATVHAAVYSERGRVPVSVPASAVLWTGTRSLVYALDQTVSPPVALPVEVELGERVGDRFVVASGLFPGEAVVSNGAFRIDASLQIRGGPTMMNPSADGVPGGGASGGGHEH